MNFNQLTNYDFSNLNKEAIKMEEVYLKIKAEEERLKNSRIFTTSTNWFSPSTFHEKKIKDFEDFPISHLFPSHEKNLPRRYILNENACICFWKDGCKTISIRHKEDEFDKSMGFLMCCFQYYNRDLSRNKRKKVLSWLKQENIKDYLFDLFVTENNMTIKEAEAYLKDLKTEKEIKNKIIREKQKKKAKHMKEDK